MKSSQNWRVTRTSTLWMIASISIAMLGSGCGKGESTPPSQDSTPAAFNAAEIASSLSGRTYRYLQTQLRFIDDKRFELQLKTTLRYYPEYDEASNWEIGQDVSKSITDTCTYLVTGAYELSDPNGVLFPARARLKLNVDRAISSDANPTKVCQRYGKALKESGSFQQVVRSIDANHLSLAGLELDVYNKSGRKEGWLFTSAIAKTDWWMEGGYLQVDHFEVLHLVAVGRVADLRSEILPLLDGQWIRQSTSLPLSLEIVGDGAVVRADSCRLSGIFELGVIHDGTSPIVTFKLRTPSVGASSDAPLGRIQSLSSCDGVRQLFLALPKARVRLKASLKTPAKNNMTSNPESVVLYLQNEYDRIISALDLVRSPDPATN